MSGSKAFIVFFRQRNGANASRIRGGAVFAVHWAESGRHANGMQTVRASGTLGLRLYAMGEGH